MVGVEDFVFYWGLGQRGKGNHRIFFATELRMRPKCLFIRSSRKDVDPHSACFLSQEKKLFGC